MELRQGVRADARAESRFTAGNGKGRTLIRGGIRLVARGNARMERGGTPGCQIRAGKNKRAGRCPEGSVMKWLTTAVSLWRQAFGERPIPALLALRLLPFLPLPPAPPPAPCPPDPG